jgi:hypothetical protein
MKTSLWALALATGMFALGSPASAAPNQPVRYAGALTFSPDGVLFVGDNISSAVFAFPMRAGSAAPVGPNAPPIEIDGIDQRVAAALKTSPKSIKINGMAVHPMTGDIFIAVSRITGNTARPELLKVAANGMIARIEIAGLDGARWQIKNPPAADSRFRDRAGDWPVPSAEKYHAKAQLPMSTMTIVDMKFHNGELFVSGISNEEFASTLRRVKYPFDGAASDTQVRIYHVAHERYETRAPIRAMAFATIDGQDTLVAGYTCSPLVLIPVSELKNGAKVTGRTIGDMGNGQPLSMVPIKAYGQDMIFVTNAGHGPRMIPIAGMQKAVAYLPNNSPRNYPSDLSPEFPLGPVGKSVMFVGASLFADRLNDKFLVSITRDAASGSLNLEALPITPLPMKLDQIWSEFDFQGGGPPSAK